MKRILICAAFAALFSLVSCKQSDELKVMSYNVRLEHMGDGDNAWPNRKEATIEMLEVIKPDVFGVQEALPQQVQYISEQAPLYKNVGVGRDDGVAKGEFMSIFWNTEVIEMIEWVHTGFLRLLMFLHTAGMQHAGGLLHGR